MLRPASVASSLFAAAFIVLTLLGLLAYGGSIAFASQQIAVAACVGDSGCPVDEEDPGVPCENSGCSDECNCYCDSDCYCHLNDPDCE